MSESMVVGRLYNIFRVMLDIAVLAMFLYGWAQGAEPVPDPAASIANRTAVVVSRLPQSTLLVLPLPYADGVPSAEGALLGERIVTALSSLDGVRLVERAQLDRVLEEQRLSASGLVNPASAVRVGQLLGAAAILSGTVTDLGENLEVHTRITATETGEVLSQDVVTTRKTIKTFISPLWSRIEQIQKEGESFSVELWTSASKGVTGVPAARIGDTLTVYFRAERDCHVTLFDFTSSGSIHVLFPNAFMKDNAVKAGQLYALPTAEAGFKIRVQGPPGMERLKLFATTRDVPLFERNYATESFRSIDDGNFNATRDLEVVLDSLEGNQWAETHCELLIEQTLRIPAQE